MVIIGQHILTYSEWGRPEALLITSVERNYKLPLGVHELQDDCNDNCPDGNKTMPDSIRVKILNPTDKQVVKDTVFSCEDYSFNGDDIELPTITIP